MMIFSTEGAQEHIRNLFLDFPITVKIIHQLSPEKHKKYITIVPACSSSFHESHG